MKLAKSLLLGSAAGLVAVAGAQAADLPVKAKNYEYVRICSAYGAGFFYIPGTDTCLKIGGRVRAEYLWRDVDDWDGDDYNRSGFRSRARINLDARTATEYGTLRAFIRAEITHNSGAYVNANFGSYEERTSTTLDRAFVQFLGFTAGRTVSFFDFSEGTNWGTLRFSDGEINDVLAYTATFGNGFSFTIALEDPVMREGGGYAVDDATAGAVAYGTAWNTSYAYGVQTTEIPDIVAAFRVDQSWGSAQLSAAAHQNRVSGLAGTDFDDEWGFAVGLGAKINMDFLSPGDYFWLNATYASGALSYLGIHGDMGNRMANVAGYYTGATATSTSTDTADGWQVSAGFEHWWTPTFHSSIFGSYAKVDSIDAAWADPTHSWGHSITPEFEEFRVGLQNVWTPVKGLDIGLEVMYFDQEFEYSQWDSAVGAVSVTDEEKGWEARIRVQRDF